MCGRPDSLLSRARGVRQTHPVIFRLRRPSADAYARQAGIALKSRHREEVLMKRILEVCVESVEGAMAAQEGGADRVELCANLLEGGTTPSAGSILQARRNLDITLQVMIRPRGGDFCYSATEFAVMKLDIETARNAGAHGVVIGMLREDGSVDEARTQALTELARPMSVTFHRAFDMARDPFQALETLSALGIDRILTSGQESSVLEGLNLIADLVRQADNRIIIMPGGGITERNFSRIVERSGAREFHVAALENVEGPMKYRNTRCYMGGELRPPEFSMLTTDPGRVRTFVRALQ
jgi:copper homeostasis protein